jgi:hypothetical protein
VTGPFLFDPLEESWFDLPLSLQERLKCERKDRFVRWDIASKAAKRAQRSRRHDDVVIEVFACHICGGAHVGARPKGTEKPLKRSDLHRAKRSYRKRNRQR